MKAVVSDTAFLKRICPSNLTAYLHANGWTEEQTTPGYSSLWIYRSQSGGEFEIFLPLEQSFHDYALRMNEALQTLEVVEKRSQLQVLSDILCITADVVRIRSIHAEYDDGSIPVEEGVQLFQHARDTIVSAACSTWLAKPVYPSRKPNIVLEYLDRVRFGQTERGSYVLTLISHIPPQASPVQTTFLPPEPFERRVIQTLAKSVSTVRAAAERASASGDYATFTGNVPLGISANLCEALSAMSETRTDGGIEFNFHWSPLRTAPLDMPQTVLLPSATLPVIKEAGRLFRTMNPDEVDLEGVVVKLERIEGQSEGKIAIISHVGGQFRKVHMTLNARDFHRAVVALDRKVPVYCSGELVREGRLYILNRPTGFSLEPIEGDDDTDQTTFDFELEGE